MDNTRVLLAVEHKENRRLLQECLGQNHAVILANASESLNEPFDLAIFDGFSLKNLGQQVVTRKEAEHPLFLPILLVTPRQDISLVSRHLWRSIDEIIFTPIEKMELTVRIEVLLRTRRLSIELAGRNIRLQQEIVAHQQTENALRSSEKRIQLLQKLTSELATTVTRSEVSTLIAETVVTAVGGNLGMIVTRSDDGSHVEILGAKGVAEEILHQFRWTPLDLAFPTTDVVRTGEPLWIETVEEYAARFPHLRSFITQTKSEAASITPLVINGQTVGAIGISFPHPMQFGDDEQVFFQSLAQQCAQALERARMYEEAQKFAAEVERQRIAQDLHDDLSQILYSINVIGQSLPHLWEQNASQAKEQLQNLNALTQAATAEMRTLLLELRPERLAQSNLKDLFEQLIRAVQGRRQIAISSVVEMEHALSDNTHLALYRITQECLNNIVKHSAATQATILLRVRDQQFDLRIQDNGRGFDPHIKTTGFGLQGMRERANSICASFEVITAPGQGVKIVVAE
jgi:signal transduction histidine kinase